MIEIVRRGAAAEFRNPSAPRLSATDLVDNLIDRAIARRASDIHFQPSTDGLLVRFRIDGLLQHATTISVSERAAVLSRIKIMANLDIAEHRLPQDGRIHLVTIEDPIEYELNGITQIAVHEKIGLTFASCLRSVLRQDPDVILVGEVRDVDTARIAMQASLTGHLLFATLHTNDAVGAI